MFIDVTMKPFAFCFSCLLYRIVTFCIVYLHYSLDKVLTTLDVLNVVVACSYLS